ncbi:MAG: cytochrome c nitrite reductase small subunit [Bacteroidales bacterium]
MTGFIKRLAPPPAWKVPVIIISGLICGLLFYLLHISRAASYLSDEPSTCMNCHIMAPQYATWSHSSHREYANCNDCHVPHQNMVIKYWFKAKDGMRHATIFTLRREPQVIMIREEGKQVVQENCIRCHSRLLTDDKVLTYDIAIHHARMERTCWECHRETPHGRVNSLSSVPYARVPVQGSTIPPWMQHSPKQNKH